MMSDETTLLPCPFCGAKPEIIEDRVTTWALIEHRDGCLFPTFPKHEIRPYDWEAWNTRAERTCRDTGESRLFRCSECGFGIEDAYLADEGAYGLELDFVRFCPSCGRRVE